MKRCLTLAFALLLFLAALPPAAADEPVTWTLTAARVRVFRNDATPYSDTTLPVGVASGSDTWTMDLGSVLPGIGNATATYTTGLQLKGPAQLTLNAQANFIADSSHTLTTSGINSGEQGRTSYHFRASFPRCNDAMKDVDRAGNTTASAALHVECQLTAAYSGQDRYEIKAFGSTSVDWFSRVYDDVEVTLIYTRPPPNVRPIEGKVLVEGAGVPRGRQPLADLGVALLDSNGVELERTVTKADGSYWLAWAPEDQIVTVRAYLRNDNSYPSPVTFRYGQPPFDGVASPGPLAFAASPPISVGRGASAIHEDIVFSESSPDQPPPAIPHDQLDDLGLMYYRVHQAWELAGKLGPGLHLPVVVTAFSNRAGMYWQGPTNWWTPPGNQPVMINIAAAASDALNGNAPDNREWHEFGHHVMADMLGNVMPDNQVGCPQPLPAEFSCNHFGFANLNTSDSWTEGFAEFYSMLVGREMENKAQPELYRWEGIEDNLESNYLAWTFTAHDPANLGSISADEEFAVAGLLWDLLDSADADDATTLRAGGQTQTWADCVQVPLTTLWSLLTKDYGDTIERSPVPPADYGYLFDVKHLYDALKSQGIGQAQSRALGITDLDELFLVHGFFADRLDDDRFWQSDEAIGRAADAARPGRRDRELPPGSYIAYTAQTAQGQPVTPARFSVEVRFAPPFEHYGYGYRATPDGQGRLPFHAPDPQYRATASITAWSGAYQSQPVTVDTQQYWQAMAANPQTPFMQAAFTMTQRPAIFLPLVTRGGASASGAQSLAGTAKAPRACVPADATPTPTPSPTPTATPTATPTVTPQPQEGIMGKVTFKGAPPPVPLDLQLEVWGGTSWDTLLETTTEGNGEYLFLNAPALGGGQVYRVAFRNGESVESDSRFLWSWLGRKIEAYGGSGPAPGGNFDIADVPLASPGQGASVHLPADFCWTPRGVAGDNYKVMLYSWDLDQVGATGWLGNVGCAGIAGLPAGWPNDGAYTWWVRVGQGNPDAEPFNYGDAFGEALVNINW
jgi:hypothetical protein